MSKKVEDRQNLGALSEYLKFTKHVTISYFVVPNFFYFPPAKNLDFKIVFNACVVMSQK